jgi:hypothetical protein
MNSKQPVARLERLLSALERDLLDATDEEILAAAAELGMNPNMKGSAALVGVTFLVLPKSQPESTSHPQAAPRARRRLKSDPPPER